MVLARTLLLTELKPENGAGTPGKRRLPEKPDTRYMEDDVMRNMNILLLLLTGGLLASPVLAEDPYSKSDDTWVSISGEVESVTPDAFVLDFGEGMITVEMDDGDRDADGYKLIAGDHVTVTGKIDDDLFETRTIEASSVYVENIGTRFHASPIDEEDGIFAMPAPVVVSTPVVLSEIVVQGTVSNVGLDQFSIDTGLREITVEIDELGYNPLDDEGYQQLAEGDVVSVTGTIEPDFMQGRIVMANSVITLAESS